MTIRGELKIIKQNPDYEGKWLLVEEGIDEDDGGIFRNIIAEAFDRDILESVYDEVLKKRN